MKCKQPCQGFILRYSSQIPTMITVMQQENTIYAWQLKYSAYLYVCMCVCICVWVRFLDVRGILHICVHACICTCVYVCVCVCGYLQMCDIATYRLCVLFSTVYFSYVFCFHSNCISSRETLDWICFTIFSVTHLSLSHSLSLLLPFFTLNRSLSLSLFLSLSLSSLLYFKPLSLPVPLSLL